MKYRNLFFDLDDTIWAFSRNARDTFEEVYRKYSFERYFDSFDHYYTIYQQRNTELWIEYGEGKITKDELNVAKIVKQFNIQAGKVAIAYKTDQTAQRRNDVARRLYLLGKSTILDLNAAIAEKDNSRRAYIAALYNYWNLYYGLRSLTGYDFEKMIPITEDYELLLNN